MWYCTVFVFLIYFTEHNAFKVHPRYCKWQDFLFLWLNNIPLCILHHISFIHSSVNRHLGCFYILASNCILGHLLQRSENLFSHMFRAWIFAQPKPRKYLNIHQWYHTTEYNLAIIRIWLQIQAKMWMTLNWEKNNLKRAHTVWFLLYSIHEVRDPEKITGCQRDRGGDECGYKGVARRSFMVMAQLSLNCGQNSTQLHIHKVIGVFWISTVDCTNVNWFDIVSVMQDVNIWRGWVKDSRRALYFLLNFLWNLKLFK